MGEMNLSVRPRRRRTRTTRSDGSHPKYPNLLKGLEVIRPDQVWCADITYIPLANSSTVYLAFLIDVELQLHPHGSRLVPVQGHV